MRIAFVGVSHWHSRFYIKPASQREDVKIVGVSDPQPHAVTKWTARLAVPGFADYRELCDQTRPDLVFVLGRHIDMAEVARYLISRRIRFVMEKPCGRTVAEIADLARMAAASDVFAAVPFSYRYSKLLNLIGDITPDRQLVYASFKTLTLLPGRYNEQGVGWNLDERLAGGGCTLNLSGHFFDLVRVLAPAKPWTVTGASMSNRLTGVGVEDRSTVLLESDGRLATVETGYVYPSGGDPTDLSFSLCVGTDYYRCAGPDRIYVSMGEGPETEIVADTSQVAYYTDFTHDTIDRAQAHQPPMIDLDDMVEVARLTEAAYRLAGYKTAMT